MCSVASWQVQKDLKEKVAALVEPELDQAGCELADIVLAQYKGRSTLRVFVYADGGVSLDRCAKLSRTIGKCIEGTNLFERGYTLEVSSPGLDRPLTGPRDFRHRVGETVKVVFTDPQRKKITAEIIAATENCVEFKDETGNFTVDLAEIEKATILF
jgi:ribosome maturation factor RimP